MIKVLVVDDSALVRKLLGQIFGREPDFEVEFARDGVGALVRATGTIAVGDAVERVG